MEHQQVDLSQGGMVAVLLGGGFDCPKEFRYHPQVQVIDSTVVSPTGIDKHMPNNTKLALTTRNVGAPTFAAFKVWCQRHRIAYVPCSSESAIAAQLGRLLAHKPVVDVEEPRETKRQLEPPPTTLAEAAKVTEVTAKKTIAPHGAIAKLIEEECDIRKGTTEEARRLFDIARSRKITTTLASLQQGIRNRKRKTGIGDIPVSVSPDAPRLTVLEAFDHAIDALQKGRAYVEQVNETIAQRDKKIATLTAKLSLLQEAFAGLGEEE